ncbi:MAG: TonB family protein [Myxococcales bacterium]|nr:TonB family protein [Myxococcales bacterium]
MNRRDRALIAALASAALHLLAVPPGLVRLRIDVSRPLEIALLDPEQAAEQGPFAAAEEPETAEEPRPSRLAAREREKPPEPAERPARPQEPPAEPAKQPPPLVVLPNAHLKMVDQDQFPDEEDNPDARYLAQKNHRAERETRAEQSNLLRNQAGERASTQSERTVGDPGDRERKVAELSERPGDPKRLPVTQPEAPAPPPEEHHRPSALALRQAAPALEPLQPGGLELERVEGGTLPAGRDGVQPGRPGGSAPRTGGRVDLQLSHEDYERIVGHDVAPPERQEALSQRSQTPGRWDRLQQKLALMRASLENFTPSVRPGNQSELGTRRHPFAAFIARMHRQIHRFWGFGFLAELDRRSPAHPLNDMSLWTSLEITLRGDGTVEKLVIERPSGHSTFDAAAMDAVLSAAPFETPPEAIRSRDGKVYLSWRFHRDNRQCATDFVQPHILLVPASPAPKVAGAGEGTLRAPSEPERPGEGLASRRRGDDPASSSDPQPAPHAVAAAQAGIPPEARQVAERWLAAYVRGDARWLAGHSAVPFTAGGRMVAHDGESLRAMYQQMLTEHSERGGALSFYTPQQIRRKLGRLPAGGEEADMVFAMLQGGGEDLVLLLQMADQGWRVVGIDR